MPKTLTTRRRTRMDRRDHNTGRWMGWAAATFCLSFAISVNAAPGDGSRGDGMGTQGPADSAQTQGQMSGQMQGQMQSKNGNCTPDTPADQAIVGKSLAEAKLMLQGCPWRIGMQDGKALPTTRDYRPDRRTLTIENDKVTNVTRG
ncbi:hypothetical protein PAP18089_02728 [Pandoraea apista]|uniref:Peptidase inhibitor I78 family protein n=1 Tax=Pandoraea apista TaxID=93218 RepID=A0A5E5P5E5_9BURK|nr:hypothetical protein [Pandoraea apista]VVG71742.1 hypothetical protein PAP18089_02728 [Pandoraea apista]